MSCTSKIVALLCLFYAFELFAAHGGLRFPLPATARPLKKVSFTDLGLQRSQPEQPPLLPPFTEEDRMTVVFDLDETLIGHIIYYEGTTKIHRIVLRPYARQVLNALAKLEIESVLWTASRYDVVQDLLPHLLPFFKYCIFRDGWIAQENPVFNPYSFEDGWYDEGKKINPKDLARLGERNAFLVDDRWDNGIKVPQRHILVKPFDVDPKLPLAPQQADTTLVSVFIALQGLLANPGSTIDSQDFYPGLKLRSQWLVFKAPEMAPVQCLEGISQIPYGFADESSQHLEVLAQYKRQAPKKPSYDEL